MKPRLIHAVVFASVATVAGAQTTATPPTISKNTDGKSIAVTGCIGEDSTHAGRFVLADFATGSPTYRVTGKDIRQYLGKRVSLTGAATPSKSTIAGGLTPTPNIAAQAGAIDPARAAVTAEVERNARPGNVEVPELRVKAMKAISGDCKRP